MAEQRQNNVALTDEEKEQRAKKRNRTIVTVVSVVAAVLIVVIVLLLLLVKCEPEENVDPPVGHTHTYSSWVVVDEPTCTEEGLRERTCSCGEKETEMIAALGHTAGEAVRENEKAPTCTATGSYEEVVSCTVCDEEVSRKTVSVDALGHTAGEAVKENEVAATCLAAGSYEEVVYCTVCGEEVSRKAVSVDVLGHDYKGEVTDEALCLVPGEMTYTCTRCDDSYTEEIAPLGHSWGETKPGQAPTCTSAGYTSYQTCIRCGYSNRETIPAAGHTWGDWQVTTPATCTEAGVEERTCSVCGDKETEAIAVDPTAHEADETDYIADENGHWFACSLCGKELKDTTYADHDYTGDVQNCTICGVTDSKYFYFEQVSDGYGIGQKRELEYNPGAGMNTPVNTQFDDILKLPDHYNDSPITQIVLDPQIDYDLFGWSGGFEFSRVKEIILPDSIKTIPERAFYECRFLTSITLPANLETIGDEAFAYCIALESLKIPDNVTAIGQQAFYECESLTNITIPESVTSIGHRAFRNCTLLTSITIPESVTSIEDRAFEGCDNLTSVVFADDTSEWGMKRYSDYPVESTFMPSTPEANAEALTDTYLNRIWEKQTD